MPSDWRCISTPDSLPVATRAAVSPLSPPKWGATTVAPWARAWSAQSLSVASMEPPISASPNSPVHHGITGRLSPHRIRWP